MDLSALQHIVRAAQTLADDCRIFVLGSASLLATFPELGAESGLLANTYDADLSPEPFDESTGQMLNESLGEARAFHLRHGYHADILRPAIFETLPSGWRKRLIHVPECTEAYALDPHDLAAVKLMVARPKDIHLIQTLARMGKLQEKLVQQRLGFIEKVESQIVHSAHAFQVAFGAQ